MPATLTYPGVYIEEVPSGVRTITGVATSITAFIGRALRGPVNKAETITSYADFERIYGGLWLDSTLGTAVRDFYAQGGTIAVIVRVHKDANKDVATIDVGTGNKQLKLVAASPGEWGKKLKATIDLDVATPTPPDPTLFNLTVTDTGTAKSEVFRNVSAAAANPRRLDIVLKNDSQLVRVAALPTQTPVAGPADADQTTGNNGGAIDAALITGAGLQNDKKGLYALEDVDLVNLIVVPPYTPDPNPTDIDAQVLTNTIAYAVARRAMVIMDPPSTLGTVTQAVTAAKAAGFTASKNAAVYYPRIRKPDPLRNGQLGTFPPAGAVAGVIARTDATRGVWKAPAGIDAHIDGVVELDVALTDREIGQLNPLGVNCLRAAPGAGHVVWGARTREGNDRNASEWTYLPVRRTALFLEESLYRGTQWVVFEPNDAPLWAQIRLNVGAFMNNLFRQGAFAGTTPKEAYFVKCDAETTTQDDVNLGIVNIIVGFAPLKPAEFVVVALQQMAGQTGSA
jgi:hypothetical protein